MLATKYLKDGDEDDMRPLYFQMDHVSLGNDEKHGIALRAVDPSVFDPANRNDKGRFDPKHAEESNANILRVLEEKEATFFHTGLRDRDLAEALYAPAPDCGGEEKRNWDTKIAQCAERIRKRRSKGKAAGYGTSEAPGVDATVVEWRWHTGGAPAY
jgi:hypothetical protein